MRQIIPNTSVGEIIQSLQCLNGPPRRNDGATVTKHFETRTSNI